MNDVIDVLIAIPTNSRTPSEIQGDITRADAEIRKRINKIPFFLNIHIIRRNSESPVWIMAESLKFIENADIVYFPRGWEDYQMTRAMHDVCKTYEKTCLEESEKWEAATATY